MSIFSRIKTNHLILIMVCFILLFAARGTIQYFTNLEQQLENQAESRLQSLSQNAKNSLELCNSSFFTPLENILSFLQDSYSDSNEFKEAVKGQFMQREFRNISIHIENSLDDLLYSSKLSQADTKNIERLIDGQSYTIDIDTSSPDQFVILLPIRKEQNLKGVVRFTCKQDKIMDLLSYTSSKNFGTTYFLHRKTERLLQANGINLNSFDLLKQSNFKGSFSYEDFQEDLTQQQTGYLSYKYQDNFYYTYYEPIRHGDWYLFHTVSKDQLINSVEFSQFVIRILINNIIIILVIIAIFMFLIHRLSSIEARKENERIAVEHKRYQTVMEHSNGVVWEYDIPTDTLTKSDPDTGIYTGKTVLPSFESTILNHEVIHPEDIEVFHIFCTEMANGKEEIHTELRAKDIADNYAWFELSATTVYDQNNKPLSVIGQTINTTKRKEELEQIKYTAERDLLTKLYNRSTLIEKVSSYLKIGDEPLLHAFLIIDIDHFKYLNDSLGHVFGDALLMELSSKLSKAVTPLDIVGRMGGDEFIVFLYNIPSVSYASKKADEFNHIFNKIYARDEEVINVSASIGVSFYPSDGTDFDTLLRNADIALYECKLKGDNCYTIYSDISPYSIHEFNRNAKEHKESNYQKRTRSLIDTSIISNTVEVLFDIRELQLSLQMALALIGNYYNLDRVCIMEYDSETEYTTVTTEWTSDNLCPTKTEFNSFSKEQMNDYSLCRNVSNGIFYSNNIIPLISDTSLDVDTVKLLGLSSTFQCSLLDKNEYRGFINANILDTKRDWSKHEIDSLSLLSKIISGYLMKFRNQERADKIEKHDSLTGAYNIVSFSHEANRIVNEHRDQQFLIMYTDIDRFKFINDSYGYAEGDRVLQEFAKILESSCIRNEIFGRITADKFIVLCQYDDYELFLARINRFIDELSKIHKTDNDYYKFAVKIGLYPITEYENMSINIDRANIARQSIQERHKTTYAFYDDTMKDTLIRQKEIEDVMEEALYNDEFIIYYQPKFDLLSNSICGAEALVRWQREGSLIPPNDFVPIFEENLFIIEIDFYVFRNVCEWIKKALDDNKVIVPISVNFSRVHLKTKSFISRLKSIMHNYQIPPNLIEIEITESAFVDDDTYLAIILEELHSLGIKLSMDDFGSGLSSLNLLRKLPFDTLKLDKTFFQKGSSTKRERTVISNVVRLARELSMELIPEGVETEDQAQFLRDINCTKAQGYLFAKPMPEQDFNQYFL